MNWNEVKGNWKEFRGRIREQWGKLTDDDYDVIAGRFDQFVGMIQRRYGWTKEQIEQQLADYEPLVRKQARSMAK